LPQRLGGLLSRVEGGHIVHQADFALTSASHLEETLSQLDRLLHRVDLHDRVPGNQLFGFGEGTIGDGKLASVVANPYALGVRLQTVGREQESGSEPPPFGRPRPALPDPSQSRRTSRLEIDTARR